MAAIVDIRDWIRDILIALTPESRPGDTFVESIGTESLENMPVDGLYHRSFRVVNNRDAQPRENFLPLEVEGTVTIEIAYVGEQDDIGLERWLDEDEELIKRNLLQASPTPDFPASLCNINFVGASEPIDRSDGGRNILILPITYQVHYQLGAA